MNKINQKKILMTIINHPIGELEEKDKKALRRLG